MATSLRCLLSLVFMLAWASAHAGTVTVKIQVQDSTGHALPDAVVFLESAEAKAAVKALPGLEIAQQGQQFVPAVSVVPVGSAVQFPNRDTVRHQVYSFSPTKTFELKLYAGKPANPVVFDRPGIAVLGCNIHDHMTGWVVVVETPYFARTAADGRAAIVSVPPGAYRLRTWAAQLAPGAAALDQPFVVGPNGGAVVVKLSGAGS